MDSLFNWQDPALVASNAHSNTYNEIWGYAKGEAEYAVIGTTAGTHIFDVTNPAVSEQVAFVDAAVTGPQVIHRDYHTFQDYLYIVCDEGPSSLQIVDLTMLPDTAELVYDSDALFPRSHNIYIDTTSARMYVCGGTVQFAVYSLANPEEPTLLVDCPDEVPFWSAIGYVHDVFVRGDTAYLNAGDNGLFVVDFRNIDDINMLGSLDVYTQSGYNHSGWLMDDEPYYALADETHGMDVKIIDVSDMSDLDVTDTIGVENHPASIPHNLIYKDQFLYVSYYFDGLYMFDCSNPANPTLAGFYDTSTEPHADGLYRGCWGVYPFLPSGNILASDMQTGLWVLSSPLVSGIEETTAASQQISVYPNPTIDMLYLPATIGNSEFVIIDMNGRRVASGKTSARVSVADLSSGLHTIQVRSEENVYHSRFVKQ